MNDFKNAVYDINKLSKFLNDVGAKSTCYMCGHNNWSPSDDFYYLTSHKDDNVIMPNIALVCGNCGNTVLINAIKVGLFPSKDGE